MPVDETLAVIARQRPDLFGRHTADRCGAFGTPLQRPLAQRLPAQRVAGDVVMVQPVVGNQLVHQRQGQRRIGARQQRNVFVALFSGFALARVNADQPGAIAFCQLGVAPEVQVAANRIAAPDDDEPGLGKKLHSHADLAAQRMGHAFGAGGGANRAVQKRRPQPVEKPSRHAFALNLAHGAGIAVGQDGFGIARRNNFEARCNVAERRVPAHRLELAAAFGADALEGLQQPLGMVGALGVARNLVAQHAAGLGMIRVALHPGCDAVFHGGQQGAGVGAVMRAGAAHLQWREVRLPGGCCGKDIQGNVHASTL